MATINKKISATDYERIGDTQGILIPIDREPDFDSGIITDVTSGSKTLTHNLNTSIINLDIVVMLRRTSDQTWQRFDSQLYHVNGSNYGFAFGEINLNTIALFITDTGPIILTNAFTTLAGATDAFRVVCWKRTERVPYIIANKGALVSSDLTGKVSFNDDGIMSVNEDIHEYTSPLDHLYDFVIGKYYRADGKWKPIYKATVNIPQYTTSPGNMVRTEVIPAGNIDCCFYYDGWLENVASPGSKTVLGLNSSMSSGNDFHMTWFGVSPGVYDGYTLNDRTGISYGVSTYKGVITLKFTAQKDSWV